MPRTVKIRLQSRTIEITPSWAGEGIAIHKPIGFDAYTNEPYLKQVQGLWHFTHINSGLAMGSCHGNLERAKTYAKQWDAEFAALQAGQVMARDRVLAWKAVVEEMRIEPPRRQPAHRRSRKVPV